MIEVALGGGIGSLAGAQKFDCSEVAVECRLQPDTRDSGLACLTCPARHGAS